MKKNLLAVCAAMALLAACGKSDTPPAPASTAAAPPPAAAPAPKPVAENTIGKGVYGKTCAICHAAGIGGAPKPKDQADWSARLAQGKDVLYKHAIEGYNGSKGAMPARGGNSALSDDEVKASVDFMLTQAKL